MNRFIMLTDLSGEPVAISVRRIASFSQHKSGDTGELIGAVNYQTSENAAVCVYVKQNVAGIAERIGVAEGP